MVITVANRKGGVGKSTCAFNLGSMYALQGKRVLFLDLDSQANLSLLCRVAPSGLDDFKAGRLVEIGAKLSILPASKRLTTLENEIHGMFDRNIYLKTELLPKLPAYDYLIIDTPPSVGILNVNALVVSDFVHIIVNADSFSIAGLVEMREIIAQVKGVNPAIKTRIVLNASMRGRTFTDAAKEILAKDPEWSGIEIPHRQHVINANALKRPAIDAEEIRQPFEALAALA